MVTIQSADNALKSFYLDAVKESLDKNVSPFFAAMEHKTNNVVGKDVRKSIRIGVGGGVGAGTETGDLPKNGAANRLQFVTTLKNLYGTIQISDKALRAASKDEGAFVNILNDEMESLVQNAKLNFGRMLFGDGNGCLAKVDVNHGNGVLEVFEVNNLMEGMIVDVYDADDELVDGLYGVKINSVDRNDLMVHLDATAYSDFEANGAKIYLHESRGNELSGLAQIFDMDCPLYGIEREETNYVNPIICRNVGKIDQTFLQKIMDRAEGDYGCKINFILCSYGVKRALMSYFEEKGVVLPTVELAGGYKAVSWNGVPIVADRFCPKGTMYMLNTDDFKIHQLCDWQWLESEDGKILKQVPGKPVYTATLVKYAEMICERPCGQACLSEITED